MGPSFLSGIKMHRGGIRGKQWCVTSWLHNKKKRVALCCSLFQTHRCSGKQFKVCVDVSVCVCVCLPTHLYCPLLNCPWSVKRTASSKNRHIKTECLQSCEKCSLGIWWLLCCSGSCGKKRGRETAGALHCQSQGDKGKALSQEHTSLWVSIWYTVAVCTQAIILALLHRPYLCTFSLSSLRANFTKKCWVNIDLKSNSLSEYVCICNTVSWLLIAHQQLVFYNVNPSSTSCCLLIYLSKVYGIAAVILVSTATSQVSTV